MPNKTKKTVYLIGASAVYGESVKSAYLPYACGCLAAYAWADEYIKNEYTLGRFIFTRENIDTAIASLEKPYFVGFSSYIWNMEYNKAFAAKLKERYPDVIIAFGGHNIAPDGSDLNNIPSADIMIHGEGEVTFKSLLTALAENKSLHTVNGISFRENGTVVTTEPPTVCDISDFPSPYLEGYFDDIIKNSGISPSVIWETNRGCPNRCAFCDWGLLKSRVRLFPMERITAELKWMADNKVEYVYCADANFGLFPRDSEIADMIISSKERFGYPRVFKTNYTKNKDDVVFSISSRLINAGIGKSPTLSFQSLSPDVLKNIGRSNMELDHFKNLMARYGDARIPVYSELIIGLPGESYESFSDGISKLLECNQHTSIGIYPCELLPNSVMGRPDYRELHNIKTVHTRFSQYHIKPTEEDVPEHSNIVINTRTMNTEDWKRSFIFSICVQAFHNLALTRAFAIYLYHEKNISYKTFYELLIKWLAKEDNSCEAAVTYKHIRTLTDGIVNGENSFSVVYGDREKLTWSYEEYMFLRIVKNSDDFFKAIVSFLSGFDIESDILTQLIAYQKNILKRPGIECTEIVSDYDFYGYFQNIYKDSYTPLEKKHVILRIKDKSLPDWDECAKINVWYGRRDDAQLYTGKKNKPEIICND